MALPWPFAVQRLVARATGDQGLPAVRSHTLDPQGFILVAWLVQVRKPADVVHFTLLLRAAELTRLRQETLPDFTAMSVHLRWCAWWCNRVAASRSPMATCRRENSGRTLGSCGILVVIAYGRR
jgi:hypothetical protein